MDAQTINLGIFKLARLSYIKENKELVTNSLMKKKKSSFFWIRVPNPQAGDQHRSGPWPVRNRAAQQEVSGSQAIQAASVSAAAAQR